jgi:hypothetical protein
VLVTYLSFHPLGAGHRGLIQMRLPDLHPGLFLLRGPQRFITLIPSPNVSLLQLLTFLRCGPRATVFLVFQSQFQAFILFIDFK